MRKDILKEEQNKSTSHGEHDYHRKGHGRCHHHGKGHHPMGKRNDFSLDLTTLTEDTIVCKCQKITYKDILNAIEQGAKNYEEVQAATNCGVGCEKCVESLKQLVTSLCK